MWDLIKNVHKCHNLPTLTFRLFSNVDTSTVVLDTLFSDTEIFNNKRVDLHG